MLTASQLLWFGLTCLMLFACAIGASRDHRRIGNLEATILLFTFALGTMSFFTGMFLWIGWWTLFVVPVAGLGIVFLILIVALAIKVAVDYL